MTATDRVRALVVVVLWGLNFVAIDIALRDFPPLFFAGLRLGGHSEELAGACPDFGR